MFGSMIRFTNLATAKAAIEIEDRFLLLQLAKAATSFHDFLLTASLCKVYLPRVLFSDDVCVRDMDRRIAELQGRRW